MELITDLERDLEAIRSIPLRSPRYAELATQALNLLAELADWHTRAQSFIDEAWGEAFPPGDSESLANLPLHEAAARVLLKAGQPLHVKDIAKRIYDGGWRHPRPPYVRPEKIRVHLASVLHQQPDRFERVAPNTFKLKGAK